MGNELIVLTVFVMWLSLDVALGYGIRYLYLFWYPQSYLNRTFASSTIERIWISFRTFLWTALDKHYLVSGSHRRLIQPDGTLESPTVFDPHYGWRWATSRRVDLSPIERTSKRVPPDAGLFTDRNGVIPNRADFEVNLANKLAGQYRIFLLGGSSVAGTSSHINSTGHSIANNETIAAVMERKLAGASENMTFQIINFGVHGYASAQEFLYYGLELVHFPHDMVISFHGYNDANLALYHNVSIDGASPGHWSINRPNLHNRTFEVTSRVRSQEQSSILRFAASLLQQVLGGLTTALLVSFCIHSIKSVIRGYQMRAKEIQKAKDESLTFESAVNNSVSEMVQTHKLSQEMLTRIDEYAERMVTNDLHLGSIAASEGQVFLSILQPILVSKHILTEEERFSMPSGATAAAYLAFTESARRNFRDRSDDVTALGGHFIDFSSLLDSSEKRLYSDIIHYSDEGIDFICNSLSEIVSGIITDESAKGQDGAWQRY